MKEVTEPVVLVTSTGAVPGDVPMSLTPLVLAALVALGAWIVATEAADLAYGEYLAGECITCHRNGADDGGIPALRGRPAQDLIAALDDYRAGRRANVTMQNVARSLDHEQTEAVAAYFESIGSGGTQP